MARRRSPLSRFERDAYLAARIAGDLHAAEQGPGALAGRVARREVRRGLYAVGVPVVPLRGRGRPSGPPAGSAPAMGPLGAIAVLFGLAVLVGGTIACAATGQWAGMVFVVIFGFGPMLLAGRGGRDGIRR